MPDAKTIADLALSLKGMPRDKTVVIVLTLEGPKPLGYCYASRCWVDETGAIHVLGEIRRAPQGQEERPLIVFAPAGQEWDRR